MAGTVQATISLNIYYSRHASSIDRNAIFIWLITKSTNTSYTFTYTKGWCVAEIHTNTCAHSKEHMRADVIGYNNG